MEQLLTFSASDLIRLLQNVSNIVDKNVVIQRDFNFQHDSNLELKGVLEKFGF